MPEIGAANHVRNAMQLIGCLMYMIEEDCMYNGVLLDSNAMYKVLKRAKSRCASALLDIEGVQAALTEYTLDDFYEANSAERRHAEVHLLASKLA